MFIVSFFQTNIMFSSNFDRKTPLILPRYIENENSIFLGTCVEGLKSSVSAKGEGCSEEYMVLIQYDSMVWSYSRISLYWLR